MALDGITVAGIVSELNQKLIGGELIKFTNLYLMKFFYSKKHRRKF